MNIKVVLKILVFLIILSFLVPVIQVGSSTHFRLDRIIQVFTIPVLILYWSSIRKIPLMQYFIFVGSLLLIFNNISDFIGNYYFVDGQYRFTLRSILMLSKVLIFVFFSYVVYYKQVNQRFLYNLISLVFGIGLLIGVLQYFGNEQVINFSIKNYVLSETQESNFTRFSRIFGTSGGIISWSGICILTFFYFYYLSPQKWVRILGILLSIFNILGAGSRSGIISLLFTFIIIQYLSTFFKRNTVAWLIGNTVVIIISLSVVIVSLLNFFPDQFEFLLMRFDNAEEAMTTAGRGLQLVEYFNLMNSDFTNYFFGIGSTAVAELGYLEIDPVYIIVSYGLIGFVLHYCIILLLIYNVNKLKHVDERLYLFIMSITIGSLIFSAGFFFLQEIYMGLVFWWLIGIAYGGLLLKRDQLEEQIELSKLSNSR